MGTGNGARSSDTFKFDAGVLSLAWVPFVMVLGNSILIPVIPAMQAALHLSPASSGLVITAFSVPAGLLIPFAGFLADRWGRKAVMVPGLIVFSAGGLIAVAAALVLKDRAFGLLMAGRVVQGLGAAGTANIAMALAGDLFTGKARGQAMGVLEASNGLGKVTSPILGAALGLLAWYAPFVFFTVLAVPVALAVGFLTRDVRPSARASVKEYLGRLLEVSKRKGLALGAAFLAGMSALFLLFGTLFYLSEVLERDFHIEGVLKGLVLAVPVLASSVMAYLSGAYLQGRCDRRYLVSGGLGLIAVSLVGAAFLRHPFLLFGAVLLVGVGTGTALATLNVLVTSAVPRTERGMVTSEYGAVRFFGVAVGPPVFGLLMGRGPTATFLVAALVAAVAAVAALAFIDERRLMGTAGGTGSAGRA